MCKKNLILGRNNQFTARKWRLTFLFFTWFSIVTYILGSWVIKSVLNVVSANVFDDLRYLFENAYGQHLGWMSSSICFNISSCWFKMASAMIFLISNYTEINSEKCFTMSEYRNELSSCPFWRSIFTNNLAAEYDPCPRTVNSAM